MEESDYPPLIFDIGSYKTKIGFGGDDDPIFFEESVIGKTIHPKLVESSQTHYIGAEAISKRGILSLRYFMERGVVRNWEEWEMFIDVSLRNLSIDPSSQKCLILDSPLASDLDREKIIQVMFETFQIPLLSLCNTASACMFGVGKASGLVLHSGFDSSEASLVEDGRLLRDSTTSSSIGGSDITNYMIKMLAESGFSLTCNDIRPDIRPMKERVCFVSQDIEEEKKRETTVEYTLPDDTVIQMREPCYLSPEPIFDPLLVGMECLGVQKLVYDAISNCEDLDRRAHLYSNIVIEGGNTKFSGFSERLKMEILNLDPCQDVKVTSQISPNLPFVGGSIISSLPTFNKSFFSIQEYNENGAIIKGTFEK